MKTISIRIALNEPNFDVSITDDYYEILSIELRAITNKKTGAIDAKALVGAFISLVLERAQTSAKIDEIYDKIK